LSGVLGDVADFVYRLDQFRGSLGDLFGRGADLGGGGGNFTRRALLFLGRGGNLSRRSVHLHPGTLHLANQERQVFRQEIQSVPQFAELLGAIHDHAPGEIAAPHPLHRFGQAGHRLGQGGGLQPESEHADDQNDAQQLVTAALRAIARDISTVVTASTWRSKSFSILSLSSRKAP